MNTTGVSAHCGVLLSRKGPLDETTTRHHEPPAARQRESTLI